MEISKAEALLKKTGFKINSKGKASDEVDNNLVIETNPTKNRYAKKNTVITIIYSTGSTKLSMEDYVGQNLDLYNLNDFRTLLSYLKQLHKSYGIVKLTITGIPDRDVLF